VGVSTLSNLGTVAYGRPVPAYLMEFFLPRQRVDGMTAVAEQIRLATRRMTDRGVVVRLVHIVIVAAAELCLCVFEAPTPADVVEVQRLAGLPFDGTPEPVELISG
jgi:hypothetical protein